MSAERRDSPAPELIFVIFGAKGDLSRRKLIPAIYYLARARLLPEKFQVVGFAIDDMTDEQFQRLAVSALEEHVDKADLDREVMTRVIGSFHYFRGDLRKRESYGQLKDFLDEVGRERRIAGNRLFYFATPPSLFGVMADGLAQAGLTAERDGWRRIVVEKPFGHDLESAEALNVSLGRVLNEHQIYRIDHYLGKETVQNILVFRFANGIFEPIWNRRYIDSVQITVAETLGVEHRAGYYDQTGALRDMVSSHLLQLLSLVVMEPPTSFGADDVRDEKLKALKAIKPLTPEDVLRKTVRGQYGQGRILGEAVPAYRAEPGVPERSRAETYVALKLELDNWRWAGVPFYLRTGKRLAARATEIAIQFKCAPFELFRQERTDPLPSNFLVIRVQPDEGINLSFTAKDPGPEIRLKNVEMEFEYADYFGHTPSTGYETLLYDCIRGDRTLFRRADQVEQSWRVLMPILEVWAALPPHGFPNYEAGSWGPESGDELLRRDGRRWREIAETQPRPKLKASA